MTHAIHGTLCATLLIAVSGAANAALVERLDGLAYYDDVADLTWLADADATQLRDETPPPQTHVVRPPPGPGATSPRGPAPSPTPGGSSAVMREANGTGSAALAGSASIDPSAGPTAVVKTYLAIATSRDPAPARAMLADAIAGAGARPDWFHGMTTKMNLDGQRAIGEKVVGDWAVVIYGNPAGAPRSHRIFYLVRKVDGWKMYPTNFKVLRPHHRVAVSDELKSTWEALAAWINAYDLL